MFQYALKGDDAFTEHYEAVRGRTLALSALFGEEDQCVQSMADASPTKWHLAHTTWFFETFILKEQASYEPFNPAFEYLFNSYYNGVGAQFSRADRGSLTRPTLEEVRNYREYVDAHMIELLDADPSHDMLGLVEIGLNHEEQHQELAVTDIKHALSLNPLGPAVTTRPAAQNVAPELRWLRQPEGLYEIGHGGEDFCFDNETPRHKVFLHEFEIASRPVTNVEFQQFVESDGYRDPAHWLSDGWAWRNEQVAEHPLYWRRENNRWGQYTLSGLLRLDPGEPVCHINYYEADAYARWAGLRLPTEAQWEVASRRAQGAVDELNLARMHPAALRGEPGEPEALVSMFGGIWEWTSSAYNSYPGFKPLDGTVGEYNGKFMCNQFVLRGGSCATAPGHVRDSYRNFFYPSARWQFTGLRLARDV